MARRSSRPKHPKAHFFVEPDTPPPLPTVAACLVCEMANKMGTNRRLVHAKNVYMIDAIRHSTHILWRRDVWQQIHFVGQRNCRVVLETHSVDFARRLPFDGINDSLHHSLPLLTVCTTFFVGKAIEREQQGKNGGPVALVSRLCRTSRRCAPAGRCMLTAESPFT